MQIQNIQEYLATGDPTRLGEAEKFSLAVSDIYVTINFQLSRVPQVDKRLQCFRFKLGFYPTKANIKPVSPCRDMT